LNFFWVFIACLCQPLIGLRYVLRRRLGSAPRILVIPQARIGDLVTQTPALRAIKKKFPSAHLSVLLIDPSLADLLACDPHVDQIILWDRKASRSKKIARVGRLLTDSYDVSINLVFQTWVDLLVTCACVPRRVSVAVYSPGPLERLFYFLTTTRLSYMPRRTDAPQFYLDQLKSLGIVSTDTERRLYPDVRHKDFARDFFAEHGLGRKRYTIGIGVSCGNKLKQWPEENFAELVDLLATRYDADVILFGGQKDKPVAAKIRSQLKSPVFDATGLFSLGAYLGICEKLSLFIAVDSGPLYVALALGVPVVDIVGPVAIEEQLSASAKCRLVRKELPCVPCSYVAVPSRACRLGHRACVTQTTAEDVLREVDEVLTHA
jgi:heptosyltransferase-2